MSGDLSSSNFPAGNGSLGDANRQRAELWYSQQVEWLRVFTFGILRNSDLVDEVLQTVFRKAIERGDEVDPGAVRAWLTRVAHNEALLLKRKQGVHRRALERLGPGRSEADPESLPIDGLMRQELAEKVRQAVDRLPAEQKFVVERRIDGDQTFAEIAAELNVPLGTVLTRMRLALAKLKLAMEPDARETRETH